MNKNNFSYWFPKIQECGIKVPDTEIYHVPDELQNCFYMESKDDESIISKWVTDTIKPNMTKYLYFMKNAVFSNKFDYQHCITNPRKIVDDIIAINYAALCVEAQGTDEIILRSVIDFDKKNTPTIYNGMPLRSEFRVFYDFDVHKVLYSVNYWDYDYCISGMYMKSDRIVFDYMKNEIHDKFIAHQTEVKKLVDDHMKNVDLQGQWSVDILLDEKETYWLIDMALAQNSAYWDTNKIKN